MPSIASSSADTFVVNQTGTLTEGKPRLVKVESTQGFTADEVLRLAASLKRGSESRCDILA